MPNTRPLTITQAALDDKLQRASQKYLVNYGFFIGATADCLPDLLDGAINFIATDRAPHTLEQKAQGYPNTPSGMPGVETSLPLMLPKAMQ